PEHNQLRDSVRRFTQNEIVPNIREWDRRQEHDPSLLPKIAELGLLGISLPEKYGGVGMDYISLGIASEELERSDTAPRTVLSVHVGLNSLTLLQWANDEQKQQFLVPQA